MTADEVTHGVFDFLLRWQRAGREIAKRFAAEPTKRTMPIELSLPVIRPGFIRATNNDAFRAGAFGIDQNAGTYISNSDATRAIYMDVRDGWYRATQTTVRAGIRAAYPIGAGELRFRAGAANELIPYFMELGFTFIGRPL